MKKDSQTVLRNEKERIIRELSEYNRQADLYAGKKKLKKSNQIKMSPRPGNMMGHQSSAPIKEFDGLAMANFQQFISTAPQGKVNSETQVSQQLKPGQGQPVDHLIDHIQKVVMQTTAKPKAATRPSQPGDPAALDFDEQPTEAHQQSCINLIAQGGSDAVPSSQGQVQHPQQLSGTQVVPASSGNQNFVQFYPNQTQYIINLHNHIGGSTNSDPNYSYAGYEEPAEPRQNPNSTRGTQQKSLGRVGNRLYRDPALGRQKPEQRAYLHSKLNSETHIGNQQHLNSTRSGQSHPIRFQESHREEAKQSSHPSKARKTSLNPPQHSGPGITLNKISTIPALSSTSVILPKDGLSGTGSQPMSHVRMARNSNTIDHSRYQDTSKEPMLREIPTSHRQAGRNRSNQNSQNPQPKYVTGAGPGLQNVGSPRSLKSKKSSRDTSKRRQGAGGNGQKLSGYDLSKTSMITKTQRIYQANPLRQKHNSGAPPIKNYPPYATLGQTAMSSSSGPKLYIKQQHSLNTSLNKHNMSQTQQRGGKQGCVINPLISEISTTKQYLESLPNFQEYSRQRFQRNISSNAVPFGSRDALQGVTSTVSHPSGAFFQSGSPNNYHLDKNIPLKFKNSSRKNRPMDIQGIISQGKVAKTQVGRYAVPKRNEADPLVPPIGNNFEGHKQVSETSPASRLPGGGNTTLTLSDDQVDPKFFTVSSDKGHPQGQTMRKKPNYFKSGKHQSLQAQGMSTNKMPPFQVNEKGMLISNVASVSQSQVGSQVATGGRLQDPEVKNFATIQAKRVPQTLKQQQRSSQKQYQTLKTRYGRSLNQANSGAKAATGVHHQKKSSTKISAQTTSKSIKTMRKKSMSRESSKDSRHNPKGKQPVHLAQIAQRGKPSHHEPSASLPTDHNEKTSAYASGGDPRQTMNKGLNDSLVQTHPSKLNCPSQNVSRVNKNLSPISILDNSHDSSNAFHNHLHKIMSQGPSTNDRKKEYGEGACSSGVQDSHQLNSFDHGLRQPSDIMNPGDGALLRGNMNLSEHIRKINKIQIKKRIQQQETQVQVLMPDFILGQAYNLLSEGELHGALSKFLEYIKLEPLNPHPHYQIGLIYAKLPSLEPEQQPEAKVANLQEAILHFEQVIKHTQNQPGTKPPPELHVLAAKSLFEIVRIHIDSRDFYEANYQLDRAFYFGFQNSSEEATDSEYAKQIEEVAGTFKKYRQLVKAIILMMKRKVEAAMDIFIDLSKGLEKKENPKFAYLVLNYASYGNIIQKNYDKSIKQLEEAAALQTEETSLQEEDLDKISYFNGELARMLRVKPQISKQDSGNFLKDDEKLSRMKAIQAEFPENKDIIRYRAIYTIQMQISMEVQAYITCKKQMFKKKILKDLELIRQIKEQASLAGKDLATRDLGDLKKKKQKTTLDENGEVMSDEKNVAPSPKKLKPRSFSEKKKAKKLVEKKDSEESGKEGSDEEDLQMGRYYQLLSTSNADDPYKQNALRKALEIVNQGLAISPKDRNLLLTRSHIRFYLHSFYEALCDIDAVIDIERVSSGEEEPNATDLLHKGRCHACLSMFKEAIADFSKVIELDDEQFDAYLFRGKCAYLIGDTSQAFLDFQKLILLQPKNPMVHAYAGNLLMTTGSYEDAAKAFSNADSVQPCAFAIYQRARCFLAIGDIGNAISDLSKSCKMYDTPIDESQPLTTESSIEGSQWKQTKHKNFVALRDRDCLQTIVSAINILTQVSVKYADLYGNGAEEAMGRLKDSTSSNPRVRMESDEPENTENEYMGSQMIYDKKWNDKVVPFLGQFLEKFTNLIEMDSIELREITTATQVIRSQANYKDILQKSIKDFELITTDSRMQQQIIPNVNRIKVEKGRAIRRYQAKHEQREINRRKKRKSTTNLLLFNIDQDKTDKQMRERGLKICPWSYYMENLFSKDDIFLYRAVINFYNENYQDAIFDLKLNYKVKQTYKILDNENESTASQRNSTDFKFIDTNLSDEEEDDDEDDGLLPHLAESPLLKRNPSNDSVESDKTDLSDVGLCSLNKNEMKFNIILCLLKLKRYRKALKKCKDIIASSPQKYHRDLLRLRDIITSWVKALKSDQKRSSDPTDLVLADRQPPILIQPFPTTHRLCKFFPCQIFSFHDQQGGCGLTDFIARPTFSFPFVKPPNMIPNVDESILHTEFGCPFAPSSEAAAKAVDDELILPQPQPLWIKTLEVASKKKSGNLPVTSREVLESLEGKSASVGGATNSKKNLVHNYQFTDTIVHANSESLNSQSQSQSLSQYQSSSHPHKAEGEEVFISQTLDGKHFSKGDLRSFESDNADTLNRADIEKHDVFVDDPVHLLHGVLMPGDHEVRGSMADSTNVLPRGSTNFPSAIQEDSGDLEMKSSTKILRESQGNMLIATSSFKRHQKKVANH